MRAADPCLRAECRLPNRLHGALESYPGAARALAASIRRKNTSSLIRNGLAAKDNGAAVLGYLDRLTGRAGLPPGEPAVSILESVHID
eukprot:COSAG01_NODE_32726_length_576_cov_1.540881_1_plen_88_part_00